MRCDGKSTKYDIQQTDKLLHDAAGEMVCPISVGRLEHDHVFVPAAHEASSRLESPQSIPAVRTCIFCDRKANTLEDVWPKWLLASIGHDSTSPTQYWNTIKRPPKTWPGPRFLVKQVCKDCNEGWMSTLENGARRTMGSLVNDISVTLDSDRQQILALWGCKTAMVFEGAKQNKNQFYSEADRHFLRERQVPPTDTLVWIGRYSQSNLLHAEGRKLVARQPIASAPAEDGCATTFVMKKLVIQVLSIKRKPESHAANIRLEVQGGSWGRKLIQIWPVAERRVSWPPTQSFGEHDNSLKELIRRFSVGIRFEGSTQ